jgi:hypothetical protein
MAKPDFPFIESLDSKLTEFEKNALVEAIDRGNNYKRDAIQRDFLQVLANGIASSIVDNKSKEGSSAVVRTPFDLNNFEKNRGERRRLFTNIRKGSRFVSCT